VSELQRRYEKLLQVYPVAFRSRYEGEMLGTLLSASGPSQAWPSPREAAAILAGGLRERAVEQVGTRQVGPLARAGFRLGALLCIGFQMSICVQRWNHDWSERVWFMSDEPQSQLMALVWATGLLGVVVHGNRQRRAALAATVVLAALTLVYTVGWKIDPSRVSAWAVDVLPVAIGVLVPAGCLYVLRGGLGCHRRRSLLAALVAPVALGLVVAALPAGLTDAIVVPAYVVLVVVAAVLVVADPRLAIATAFALAPLALRHVGEAATDPQAGSFAMGEVELADVLLTVGPLAAMLVLGAAGLRRWTTTAGT
jgi:hypothetical protein